MALDTLSLSCTRARTFFNTFPLLATPCNSLYKKAAPMRAFIATVMASQVAIQEENMRRGPWFEEEDERLTAIVALLGERRWDALAKASGLRRSGKSCRLRWMNYLRPNLKHGDISEEEEHIILQLHHQWGNKWSKIARRLPGRTDNEIKNYWRSHLKKKAHIFEKENLESVVNTKKELVVPTHDGMTLRTSDGDSTSEEDDGIPATSVDSSDAQEFSNLGFANSPYEGRVSDWIWSWPYEQNEGKIHGECCNLGSCFCYLGSFEEIETSCLWDSSSSIWDLY